MPRPDPWTFTYGPLTVRFAVRSYPTRAAASLEVAGKRVGWPDFTCYTAHPGMHHAIDRARDVVADLRAAADAIEVALPATEPLAPGEGDPRD